MNQTNQQESVKLHKFSDYQVELLRTLYGVLGGSPDAFDEAVIKTYYKFLPQMNLMRNKISPEEILDCVSEVFVCSKEEIQKHKPKQELRSAKLIYHKLCYTYTNETQVRIANVLGNKNHSSHSIGLTTAISVYGFDRSFRTLYHICEDHLLDRIKQKEILMPSTPLPAQQVY